MCEYCSKTETTVEKLAADEIILCEWISEEKGPGACVGFRSEFEIKPIEQEETCDYFAPDSADWKPCGEKATFAKYILDTSLLCAEHAAEANLDNDKS